MARTIDMQRIVAPVLAALLLLAAVAPLCLMFASPAMAMGTTPMGPSSECEKSGGSLSSCPFSQDEAPARSSAVDTGLLLFVAADAVSAPLHAISTDAVAAPLADVSPPPAHEVPLRI